ncbi:MAG: Rid family hydrolase [Pseudomonadota bacterium]
MRKAFSKGSPLENQIGFSRAIQVGSHLAISGTAPIGPSGETIGKGNLYLQTRRCLELIIDVAREAGFDHSTVVRTRLLLVDIVQWEQAARAHREVFSGVAPTCTFVEVSRFIDEHWLVEIEADCIRGGHVRNT